MSSKSCAKVSPSVSGITALICSSATKPRTLGFVNKNRRFLVLGWFLDVIHDQVFDRDLCRFQPQSELIFNGLRQRRIKLDSCHAGTASASAGRNRRKYQVQREAQIIN